MNVWNVIKTFFIILGVIAVATIIFVRPSMFGGKSGGEQASMIISAGAKGIADIFRSVQ